MQDSTPTITLPEILADIVAGEYRVMKDSDFWPYADAPQGSLKRHVQYEDFSVDILVCPGVHTILVDVYVYDDEGGSEAYRLEPNGWVAI